MKILKFVFVFTIAFVLISCNTKNPKHSKDFVYNRLAFSVIYEVNIRQYTKEGTFKAFVKHIPRLKQLGIDILWLMPIYPIGEMNRKGHLGSYYSVKNYYKINPDFGTEQDLHELIKIAHRNGMLVILDWVANHTAWDNPWVKEHPDWYVYNKDSSLHSPYDWTDVVKLDYNNKQMRDEMVNAMKYWVRVFDIDGFRCDVAMEVPKDFWDSARVELEKIKPVFMLAEAEKPELMYKAFDAYYGWHLHHIMNQISKRKMDVSELIKYFNGHAKEFPQYAMRMNFTSNHDENSWKGTVYQRMPKSYKTFAVFSFLVPDIPLIYNGQEACLNKRLKFFDKDSIQWKECDMTELYKKLIELKHSQPALKGGRDRGSFEILDNTEPKNVFTMMRYTNTDTLIALFNLSDTIVEFKLNTTITQLELKEYFTQENLILNHNTIFRLKPWEYKVFITNKN